MKEDENENKTFKLCTTELSPFFMTQTVMINILDVLDVPYLSIKWIFQFRMKTEMVFYLHMALFQKHIWWFYALISHEYRGREISMIFTDYV